MTPKPAGPALTDPADEGVVLEPIDPEVQSEGITKELVIQAAPAK